MPACRRQVEIDMQLDGLPEQVRSGVSGDNPGGSTGPRGRRGCSPAAAAENGDGRTTAALTAALPTAAEMTSWLSRRLQQ